MTLSESPSHEAAPAAPAALAAAESSGPASRLARNLPKPRKGVRRDKKMGPNDFKPHKSSPFYERTLVLHTLMAQQLFEGTYGRTQVALYNVRYMAPMLADEKTAKELATTVKTMLDGVSSEVDEAIEKLRFVREQKGAKEPVAFSDPYTVTVAWFTPSTNGFLSLVQRFDDLVREIETLWMLDHFDDDTKKNLGYEWRNRLRRFARSLIDLQGRSLDAVKRKLNKRPEAPQVPAEAVAAAEAVVDATPAVALVVPQEVGEVISEPSERTEESLAGIVASPAPVVDARDRARVTGRRAEKPAPAPAPRELTPLAATA